jgi:hypothetical protein
MARAIIEIVAIFLAPFLLFFIYRLIRPDDKEATDAKSLRPYLWMTLIGLLLVGASLAGGRLFAERKTGAYVPAVVKDGVVQPGHVE